MDKIRIGTCSQCGGDVMAVGGTWGSILPPPPPKCHSCGAVAAYDVIHTLKPVKYTEDRRI